MDNQQKRFDLQSALIWLAGFMDGEGSYMIQLSHEKRKHGNNLVRIRPKITVVNTHHESVEYIAQILREVGVGSYVSVAQRKTSNPKHAPVYAISINGFKRCQRFLARLLPFTFTKNEQAALLQEFIEWRLALPEKNTWTDELVVKAFEYADKLSALNTRGYQKRRKSKILRDYTFNSAVNAEMI